MTRKERELRANRFFGAVSFVLGLHLFLLAPAWAALNLEVPLEMVDFGLSSYAGSSNDNFRRSWIFLDPSHYDGATYFFEIVASNMDSVGRTVYLRSTTDGATYASVTVPANTNVLTRFRQATPWTPAAAKYEYLVRLDQTTVAGRLIVQSARIIVSQTNATKTRIQIPLAQAQYNVTDFMPAKVDATTSVTYTQGVPRNYSIWAKDESRYVDFAPTNCWTLEAVLDNGGTSATTYAALFNRSTGAQVGGAEIYNTGTVITLVDVSFGNGAANFTQGDDFEVRIRTSNSGYEAMLASGAKLYATLTNLLKAEVVYRVGRGVFRAPETYTNGQRILFDAGLFTNPIVYFETTGLCADNADRVFLWDAGTSDSATGGSDVSGSGINLYSASKIRVRTTPINPVDGHRFFTRTPSSANYVDMTHAWIVVQAQSEGAFDTHYVWSEGSNVAPYQSWGTAAHSIQDAIDVASAPSTVVVRGGTFHENVDMKDGVNLVSDTGYVPVIDAGGTGTVVSFDGSFAIGCLLDGFYITNSGANGGIYFRGTGSGIDNDTIVRNCSVNANNGPGIRIGVSGNTVRTAPVIDNNTLDNNAEEGIIVVDASPGPDAVVISNNTIRNHASQAGINLGGASSVTVGTNNMIHGNYAGIGFHTGQTLSEPVEITGNTIYGNSQGGLSLEDATSETVTITENAIYQNTWGGIGIQNTCNLVITENDIYLNGRGGIHTGTDQAGGTGFLGSVGSAVVTIRRNKVYNNGSNGYGGGIDVRHASGTIMNNLVYENHRGGIRFGDYITQIINNTVVNNGGNTFGGGIVFDALSGLVNDPPNGSIAGSSNYPYPLIRNNISAYNEMAGLRCGYMPEGTTPCPGNPIYSDGQLYRNFNLLYSNHLWNAAQNGFNPPDCGWPTSLNMSCLNQQYGGCGGHWEYSPTRVVHNYPNDIMDDPLFLDIANDDYRLQIDSPGRGSGVGGVDMGAYGGTYAIEW